MPKRASPYRTLYFRDPADFERIREKAKALGVSASEFLRRAAFGELEVAAGITPERARALEEEVRYWRERFEQMAALAQDMQAEVLQLRQELRLRNLAGPQTPGSPAAVATSLAPNLLKVLASLRAADGKFRVWTEAELREELGVTRDPLQAEGLRGALSELYRMNLIEPQRNGWRYRE